MFSFLNKIFNKKKQPLSLRKTILVVEDNEVDRTIIQKTLEKEGYSVFWAENGAVGLKKAKEQKPDLILLDCEMPIMDGQETCRRIKEDADLKNIPVLFLTGLNTPKNVVECFDLDAENFLAKPVNPSMLITQINTILVDTV
ncbi:MAG TPA: response regulator [Candidatus Omnitrophota bacterium]|nr:response regulator [Candidatus Omnitrophota bacterium]HPN88670.1 response regulator [Candidatus Omnitrophota bacterium]